MSTRNAIQTIEPRVAKFVHDVSMPKIRDDYVIVRVKAVALNPADWKTIQNFPTVGAIAGCDYAGIVEEVGKNVTQYKRGDRIAGLVHGSNSSNVEDGAFAEFIVAKAAVSIQIPDHISFEEASTLGVGIATVGQALYQSLGLALPTNPISDQTPLLVYGGSTATGTLAIQFAKLSGYTVIATASPHNHALIKSLGADHVVDYRAPDAGAQIRALTNNNLKLAFDCIAEGGSPTICSDAISSTGGVYSNLLMAETPRKDIENKRTLAYTSIGESFHKFGFDFPASSEDLAFATGFWKLTQTLLAEGKVKVHPPKLVGGGLTTIVDSLKELEEGKVSGAKLVHSL